MRRITILAALCVLLVAADAPGRELANRPLLGIAGRADRFKAQTGQESAVRHAFLGWEQGRQWGSPFSQPAQIAAGKGDAYLIALNEAIAGYGAQLYVADIRVG